MLPAVPKLRIEGVAEDATGVVGAEPEMLVASVPFERDVLTVREERVESLEAAEPSISAGLGSSENSVGDSGERREVFNWKRVCVAVYLIGSGATFLWLLMGVYIC